MLADIAESLLCSGPVKREFEINNCTRVIIRATCLYNIYQGQDYRSWVPYYQFLS